MSKSSEPHDYQQVERLISLRDLAGGFAHQINNPLSIIKVASEIIAKRISPDDATAIEAAKHLDLAAERIAQIVESLRSLSETEVEWELIDISETVHATLIDVKEIASMQGVRVDFRALPQPLPLKLCKNLISQAIAHILRNAIQAMPSGGDLHVTVSQAEVARDPSPASVNAHKLLKQPREGDPMVAITIEDNGPGIPPEILSRVTEPLYTTKPTDRGQGLGLAFAQKIAELHRGEFLVRNRNPSGVIATFNIPIH